MMNVINCNTLLITNNVLNSKLDIFLSLVHYSFIFFLQVIVALLTLISPVPPFLIVPPETTIFCNFILVDVLLT